MPNGRIVLRYEACLLGYLPGHKCHNMSLVQSGGYGGSLFTCFDAASKTIQGSYSELGYVFGSVSDDNRTATGFWFEAGTPSGPEPSWGSFEITLGGNGTYFAGTWKYNSLDYGGIWQEQLVSSNVTAQLCWQGVPATAGTSCTPLLCFGADAALFRTTDSGEPPRVCVVSAVAVTGNWSGGTGALVACEQRQSVAADGSTFLVSSSPSTFSRARCYLGGAVCTGWVRMHCGLGNVHVLTLCLPQKLSSNGTSSQYSSVIFRALSNSSLLVVRWSGLTSDVEYSTMVSLPSDHSQHYYTAATFDGNASACSASAALAANPSATLGSLPNFDGVFGDSTEVCGCCCVGISKA